MSERIEVVNTKTGHVLRRFGLDGREGRIRLLAIRARVAEFQAAHPDATIEVRRFAIDDDEQPLADDAPTRVRRAD